MPDRSFALTRAKRLTQATEFQRVFSGADRSSDRFFTVLAAASDTRAARLGLAISRRAASRAVDRNRLRRLARESFRQLDLAPLDFVVMAKPPAVATDNATLRTSLDRHFTRLSERAR
ncbi:MAG: ribonuclease P protein component [Gammaproteobacteria bacterium]|nr:ribonuclease P protein component [Gammaproteobacteria bacterium]